MRVVADSGFWLWMVIPGTQPSAEVPTSPPARRRHRRSAPSGEPPKPDQPRDPGHRRSSRRARAGQGPVLASLAMLAVGRCAWLRVAPLLPLTGAARVAV